MAQREMECDESAGGVPEDDRVFDVQAITKRGDIVCHLLKRA